MVYATDSFTDHTIAGLHQDFNLAEMISPANTLVGGRLASARINADAEAATRDIVRHHFDAVEHAKAAQRFQAVERIQATKQDRRRQHNRRHAAATFPTLFAIVRFLQGALRPPGETARQACQFVFGYISAHAVAWAMCLLPMMLLVLITFGSGKPVKTIDNAVLA
jgi:hypothetical protein